LNKSKKLPEKFFKVKRGKFKEGRIKFNFWVRTHAENEKGWNEFASSQPLVNRLIQSLFI